jgi:hypothetical protein
MNIERMLSEGSQTQRMTSLPWNVQNGEIYRARKHNCGCQGWEWRWQLKGWGFSWGWWKCSKIVTRMTHTWIQVPLNL